MPTPAEDRFLTWFNEQEWWHENSAWDALWEAYLALGGKDPDNHERITDAMSGIIATIRNEYGE